MFKGKITYKQVISLLNGVKFTKGIEVKSFSNELLDMYYENDKYAQKAYDELNSFSDCLSWVEEYKFDLSY